jgi:hypothetical protein
MLHVGLDLSRTRLDVHVMDQTGTSVAVTTAAPDVGGLASLAYRLGELGQPVAAVIESMNGARFIHDQLELRGWTVETADAVKVKGFAPLACMSRAEFSGGSELTLRRMSGRGCDGSRCLRARPVAPGRSRRAGVGG